MKNIIKAFSLISVMAVIPAAMAATSRVSMISRASPRLPSIAGYIASANKVTTTASGTSYLADVDCLNNYSDCIKADDACGSDFEECTTNALLHVHTPKCLNVLSQCTPAGMSSLFGTNNLSAISAYTTDDNEEKVYAYPTTDSALGQMITAAQIANQLPLDQCVKKYTSCLKKDSVCGEDFELCTDNKEFKKQAIACASTLARCKADGKKELFGDAAKAAALAPAAGSRLGEMVTEGAALAVNNAVATCNKVTDQCIINACSKNPNKCIEGRKEILIRIADSTNGGRAITNEDLIDISALTEKRDVKNYISQECKQTIGSNKYCYMTVEGKPVTKESVLKDPETVDEVFEDMYGGEFGRFAALKDKINQITDNFDAKIQDKCIDAMSSCAMRSCGSGIGSVCYTQSRDGSTGNVNIIKDGESGKSYKEIKSACRAIIDTDANCQYAAVLNTDNLFGDYMSDEKSVFSTLFPQTSEGKDVIGIVAYLNSLLATSYNEAAIENLRKQCQTTALSCVKSMCGKDYVNCYRRRTDITAGTYDTGASKFDNSMNKVGGVLDYNIVIGLCMNTIKNSPVCDEHLKIAANSSARDVLDTNSWGNADGNQYDSVRSGWLDANSTTTPNKDVLMACAISAENAALNENCKEGATMKPGEGQKNCIGLMDEDGCLYTVPVYQVYDEYILENAGKTLFQQLLADVEREVQAKYNAKLTKEQNICYSNNNGGIQGAKEHGSTFMWVKLKSNKVPKNYSQKGLSTKDFGETGDLYGAFCRAKITVMSDDKMIQDELAKDTSDAGTAYFAVGDAFTCGSWISQKTLESITKVVGEKAREEAGEGSAKEKAIMAWSTVAGFLGGGIGGFFGMDAIQKKGGTLGGLLDPNKAGSYTATQNAHEDGDKCVAEVNKAKKALDQYTRAVNNAQKAQYYNEAVGYANNAVRIYNDYAEDTKDKQDDESNSNTSSSLSYYDNASYTTTAATAGTTSYKFGGLNLARSAITRMQNDNTCCGDGCKAQLQLAEDLMSDSNVTAGSGDELVGILGNALGACRTGGTCPNTGCLGVTLPAKIEVISTTDGASAASDAISYGGEENTAAITSAELQKLDGKCSELQNMKEGKSRRNANLIAGAALSAVGGALGIGISKTVLDIKYEKAENEAIAKWLEEVGSHIQCYLGGEELGSYGDTISLDIE